MDATTIQGLKGRFDDAFLERRLIRQIGHTAELQHQGEGLFVVEKFFNVDVWVRRILKATLLYERGKANCLKLRCAFNQFKLPNIPPELEGLRILQMSDLHIDLLPELQPIIIEQLKSLEYDLCLITGDYRNSTREDYKPSIDLMRPIFEMIQSPFWGILGNHDFIEMAPLLEEAGLPLLINESVQFNWQGGRLFIGGIDDPHYYRTHDIPKVVAENEGGDFSLLMAHSPEVYAEAAPHFDLMLSGHTHGGQICLPGGIAIVRNGRCPNSMLKGPWGFENLRGYTSPGTGSCGVAARFFCPPEITVHTLSREETLADSIRVRGKFVPGDLEGDLL